MISRAVKNAVRNDIILFVTGKLLVCYVSLLQRLKGLLTNFHSPEIHWIYPINAHGIKVNSNTQKYGSLRLL